MAVHPYKKVYLEAVSDKIGAMMDYAVNDCELDGNTLSAYVHNVRHSAADRSGE